MSKNAPPAIPAIGRLLAAAKTSRGHVRIAYLAHARASLDALHEHLVTMRADLQEQETDAARPPLTLADLLPLSQGRRT